MNYPKNTQQPINGQVIFFADANGVTATEVWTRRWEKKTYSNFYTSIRTALTVARKMGWKGRLTDQQEMAVRELGGRTPDGVVRYGDGI